MEAHNGKCIIRYILHHKLRRANCDTSITLVFDLATPFNY